MNNICVTDTTFKCTIFLPFVAFLGKSCNLSYPMFAREARANFCRESNVSMQPWCIECVPPSLQKKLIARKWEDLYSKINWAPWLSLTKSPANSPDKATIYLKISCKVIYFWLGMNLNKARASPSLGAISKLVFLLLAPGRQKTPTESYFVITA